MPRSRKLFRTVLLVASAFVVAPHSFSLADEPVLAVPTPASQNPAVDVPKTVPSEVGTPAEKADVASRPLNVTAELNLGLSITGTLVEADVILIKTAFGEASIPLSEVAGIKFASGDDVTTTVVMLNGDSITGATDIKVVTIETAWGVAKVNGSAITSLMLLPNVKWVSNPGISGKRWSLTDVKNATDSRSGNAINGNGSAPNAPAFQNNRFNAGQQNGPSGIVNPSSGNRQTTINGSLPSNVPSPVQGLIPGSLPSSIPNSLPIFTPQE